MIKFTGINDLQMQNIISEIHSKLIAITGYHGDITVKWSSSMRTTAGRAWSSRREIHMNYRMFKGKENLIAETYAHELAHIIADLKAGFSQGHKGLWKSIMKSMGYKPLRCHDIKVKKASWKRTTVYCGCSDHHLTDVLMRKLDRLFCKVCTKYLTRTKASIVPEKAA